MRKRIAGLGAGVACVLVALAATAQQLPALRGTLADAERREEATAISSSPEEPDATAPARPLAESRQGRVEPLSAPVSPVEGARTPREDDPFAPVGIRSGGAVFYPSIEQGIGWERERGAGEASILSETTLRLRGEIERDGHRGDLDGELVWRRSIDGPELDELEGSLGAGMRLRLGTDYFAALDLRYAAGPEAATSPVVLPDLVSEPIRQDIDFSAAAGKDQGPARFQVTVGAQRRTYGDAELSAGGTFSQGERDSTLLTAALRGGYAVSPSLTPFVEAEIGRRIHDDRFDTAGYERSADRYALRAGLGIDRGEKFAGEVSLGWVAESPDDDRLATVSGLEVAAAFAWSPVRGTIVGLDASTEIETTTSAGDSGSVLYSTTLSLSREMRADLTADALVGIDYRDYEAGGNDLAWRAEAGLTWWMNRHAGLVGRVTWERLDSSLPARGYEQTGLYVGLRAQR